MTENQARELLKRAGYTVDNRADDELRLIWPGRGVVGVIFARHGEVHNAEVVMFIEHADKGRL